MALAVLLAALVMEGDLAVRVLVACEFSGVVRRAFAARGHDAWSCDLEPAEDSQYRHIQRNVLEVIDGWRGPWDLMIAHPPCTYLCNSGVKWLYKGGRKENGKDPKRWEDMAKGAAFFKALFKCSTIEHIAIENPVPHGYAVGKIGYFFDQTFQPHEFWAGEPGKGEVKRTCLWLRGLPKLIPTTPNEPGRIASVHKMGPSPERTRNRSRTPLGVAQAFAEQWGDLSALPKKVHPYGWLTNGSPMEL